MTYLHRSPVDRPFLAVLLLGIAVVTVFSACTAAPASLTANPTVEALVVQQAAQATLIQSQSEFLSYLATRMPPRLGTPTSLPTPTSFVYGRVTIEDGRCCIGAAAGTTIQIAVTFEAVSPLAPVTEMRVRAGARPFDDNEMAEALWEPYLSNASYPFTVPLNWVGFYVTAQFRDQLENISAVAQDDISVEGMPAP